MALRHMERNGSNQHTKAARNRLRTYTRNGPEMSSFSQVHGKYKKSHEVGHQIRGSNKRRSSSFSSIHLHQQQLPMCVNPRKDMASVNI